MSFGFSETIDIVLSPIPPQTQVFACFPRQSKLKSLCQSTIVCRRVSRSTVFPRQLQYGLRLGSDPQNTDQGNLSTEIFKDALTVPHNQMFYPGVMHTLVILPRVLRHSRCCDGSSIRVTDKNNTLL